MQSVTMRKVRVIHWARGAHEFTIFQVLEAKGTTWALRELTSCEILSKNLVGNADSVIYLCYELWLLNVSMDVFLGLHICKNIMDTV